jgi:hypothetical protein
MTWRRAVVTVAVAIVILWVAVAATSLALYNTGETKDISIVEVPQK